MDNNALSPTQLEAVNYCEGPQLVIAGAGSGKTKVLTHKIAYLLEQGLAPWNILALTFTNKAAREMKERIALLVGGDRARYLQMGTFHSIFSRILRNECEYLGFTAQFTIYDQSDSRSMVKAIIKEMNLDEKQYKAASVADRISRAKNQLLLPQAYAADSRLVSEDNYRGLGAIKDIYKVYAERCRRANTMDFDDLLVYTYLLFQQHEEVRRKYVERYQYVLVDEYQDTNRVQQAILLQLTKERMKVCVVGDDAQSIYSFRGANIDHILHFTQEFEGARLFKLERNYRSTQAIVTAANSLIQHNRNQIPKDVYSENETGEPLVLKKGMTDKEEALIVCKDIQRLCRKGYDYSDCAILYRTNAQSRSFEECLRKEGIPYRIYGGLSFYQRKEIKDVIAYFRMVVNPDDEEAFKRIINYPARGIGNTTLARLFESAATAQVSLWTVVSQPQLYLAHLQRATLAKIEAFRSMVDGWRERLHNEDAYQLGHDIIVQSGIAKDIFSGKEPEDIARQENLEEFQAAIQDFVTDEEGEERTTYRHGLADFLQEVSLLTDLDAQSEENEGHQVSLMTIHSAKGLEFPAVFIVGVEENIFPSPMCSDSPRGIEEERRLLYVAVTRAMKFCELTYAENRFRYGRMEYDTPSRFINDFAPGLLRRMDSPSGAGGYRGFNNSPFGRSNKCSYTSSSPAPSVSAASSSTISSPASASKKSLTFHGLQLKTGMRIRHERFGSGRIEQLEGSGENAKATVVFDQAGTKQLLLKFAKFTIES